MPTVRNLAVNFCGAFARTDVYGGRDHPGLAGAPAGVPVFFSIHGTGEEEAVALVRARLGLGPTI